MATLVTEGWTGANGAPWPAQWTVGGDTGFASSIQSDKGRLSSGTGTYATVRADLSGMDPATDTDLVLTVAPPTLNADQEGWVFARVRHDGAIGSSPWHPLNGYQLWLYRGADGNLRHYIRKYVNGAESTITGETVMTGTWWPSTGIRLQAIGTTVRYRIWDASGIEPDTWTASVVDTSLASGKVGVIGTTGTDLAVRSWDFDDLVVTDAAPWAPPPTGRVVDRWDGTALLRQRVDRWNGTALVQQAWEGAAP